MKTRIGFSIVLAIAVFAGATYAQDLKPLKPVYRSDIITYELPSWGNGAPGLVIDLPQGFKIQLRNEPDFDVYTIVRPDGANSGNVGIYIGHHPNTIWPAQASKKSGTIDSIPVVWRTWSSQKKDKTIHYSEVVIENFFPCSKAEKGIRKLPPDYPPAPGATVVIQDPPDGGCGLQMHVFMEAYQQEEIDRMMSWIATLRKKS